MEMFAEIAVSPLDFMRLREIAHNPLITDLEKAEEQLPILEQAVARGGLLSGTFDAELALSGSYREIKLVVGN